MTNEIAIRFCDEYLARHISDIDKEFLEIAKEALQQEPCEPVRNPDQLDCVSKKGVAEVLLKYAHDEVGKAFAEFLVSQINDLPPVNPQKPCDKCVYSTSEGCQYDDITETIPPFEDCISRQAVLDLVNADWKYEGLEEPINSLPPVNPQKPICPSAGVDCEDCPAYEKKSEWEHDHEILKAYSDGANEVLDKIRAEIDGLTYYWCEVNPKSVIDDVLHIIDKYAEGSGEE